MFQCGICFAESWSDECRYPSVCQEEILPPPDVPEKGGLGDGAKLFGRCRPSEPPVPLTETPRREPRPPPPIIFTARLRIGTRHGCGLTALATPCGLLRVEVVDECGPIAEYNASLGVELQVRKGDCIVAVNGKSGAAEDKLLAMSRGGFIELGLRRPVDLTARVMARAQSRLLAAPPALRRSSTDGALTAPRRGDVSHVPSIRSLMPEVSGKASGRWSPIVDSISSFHSGSELFVAKGRSFTDPLPTR